MEIYGSLRIDDLLINDLVNLIFDYGIKERIIDKDEILGMFVFDLLDRHSDEIKKNITALHSLTYIQLQFTKVNLRRVIRVYLEIEPKEALEKIKYFLKKLNLNPNDEILNKYPIIKEFIQKELNTSQLMDYKEYLKYDDFNFPDGFYKDLIDEINRCYSVGAYSAVRILTRKLLENVLIDIFKKAKVEIEKYYDDRRKTFKDFSKLITLLEIELSQNNRKLYGMLSQTEIDNLINNLDNFRTKGNTNAHSIVVKTRKEDVDNEKDDLEHLIKVLTQRIYEKL